MPEKALKYYRPKRTGSVTSDPQAEKGTQLCRLCDIPYVLNEIYRVEGCYIRFTQDELFDCAEYWNMREEEVLRIINYCTETGLFNAGIWKQVRHSDRALHPDPICVHVSRGQAQDSHSGRNKSSFRRKILLPGFPGTASCGSGVRSDLWICGSHLCSLHGTFRSARSLKEGILPEKPDLFRKNP